VSLNEHFESAVGGQVLIFQHRVRHWASVLPLLKPGHDGAPFVCVAICTNTKTTVNTYRNRKQWANQNKENKTKIKLN
jgi:hypothetical protein